MHTEPKDPHGQDLEEIINELSLTNNQVLLSVQKMPPLDLAKVYNLADCTINIADAEGFGLATLESLACETPIIVNMTGGLQEQVTDGDDNWFGVGIQPSSKAVIGSQDVPYIYEDRIAKEDFLEALDIIYKMSKEEREAMGRKGRDHVLQNYGMSRYKGQWYEIFKDVFQNFGSWESRKNYKSWELLELC